MNEKLCLPQNKAKAVIAELYEWVESILTAVLFMILVGCFLIQVVSVAGQSMHPTLQDGERLLITPLGGRVCAGDIVVFTNPGARGDPLIKRVIAVGGQQIAIDDTTGAVSVDGVILQETYLAEPMDTYLRFDTQLPATVPPGCLFVMGDNRNHSHDSRATDIGMVDERYVLGKIVYRILPYDQFGPVANTGSS